MGKNSDEMRAMIKAAKSEHALRNPEPPAPRTWTPQRGPQTAFFESDAFELLYGGAAGGGKSEALVMDAINLCLTNPGYRAILFRRTFPEIEKSLVPRVTDVLYGHCRNRAQGMEWHFPNGSLLYLSHLQRNEDKERHKSVEYDYIGFDELTSFDEDQYTYLFSRCRGSKDVPRFIRSASNSTGRGHSWVKKRFVDFDLGEDGLPLDVKAFAMTTYDYAYGWLYRGRVYTSFEELPEKFEGGEPAFCEKEYVVWKEKKSGLTRAFVPALLWGNAALLQNDPGYVRRLRTMDAKTQSALLYGSWDIFEGQFFASWNPDVHVTDPLPLPANWKRYVAIDYGYASPMCALWFCVDESGNVYVYRELYGKGMSTAEQARKIAEMTGPDEKIEWFACDPSLFQKSGGGETHAQIYDREGIALIPSSNRRAPGWALLHQALKDRRIKIFRNCVNTIRTIPTLTHSAHNVEDLDTQQEDHAVDVIRYFLLTWRGYKSPVIGDAGAGAPEWFSEAMKKKNLGGMKKKIFTRVRL